MDEITYSALIKRIRENTTSLGDIVTKHIRTFGAKGDNTTDDSAAIQSALNYSNTYHVTILFDNKKYRIASPLTFPAFVSLKGGSLTGRCDSSYNGTVLRFDIASGYSATSNNASVSGNIENITFKGGSDQFFSIASNLNLFENVNLVNVEFKRSTFLGFKNMFYNCQLGVITTFTQCACYNPYEAFFNTCSLVDVQVYQNYFSGGKINNGTYVDYPRFYKNCSNYALVQVNDNWFEFFKEVIPNCYGQSTQFCNNTVDFCYASYSNSNNGLINGNTFTHCNKKAIKDNFVGSGYLESYINPDLLNNKLDVITVVGFPCVITNNICGNVTDITDSYFLYIKGEYISGQGYRITNLTIKDNRYETNTNLIRFPDDFVPNPTAGGSGNLTFIDIDSSLVYSSLPNPSSVPPGLRFKFNNIDCITVMVGTTNTTQVFTSNNHPFAYRTRNLIPSLKNWTFNGVTTTIVNDNTVTITDPTGGWKSWTYDVTVMEGEWYRINFDTVSTLIEIYLFDASNNKLSTLYNRTMDYIVIPTNVTKLQIALRSNLEIGGSGTFKNVILNKYDVNGNVYGNLVPINGSSDKMLTGFNSDGTIYSEIYGK